MTAEKHYGTSDENEPKRVIPISSNPRYRSSEIDDSREEADVSVEDFSRHGSELHDPTRVNRVTSSRQPLPPDYKRLADVEKEQQKANTRKWWVKSGAALMAIMASLGVLKLHNDKKEADLAAKLPTAASVEKRPVEEIDYPIKPGETLHYLPGAYKVDLGLVNLRTSPEAINPTDASPESNKSDDLEGVIGLHNPRLVTEESKNGFTADTKANSPWVEVLVISEDNQARQYFVTFGEEQVNAISDADGDIISLKPREAEARSHQAVVKKATNRGVAIQDQKHDHVEVILPAERA